MDLFELNNVKVGTPKEKPEDWLSNGKIPDEFMKEYHPSRNRVVIQYTDGQLEKVKAMLGLGEIKELCYNFEDLHK